MAQFGPQTTEQWWLIKAFKAIFAQTKEITKLLKVKNINQNQNSINKFTLINCKEIQVENIFLSAAVPDKTLKATKRPSQSKKEGGGMI